MAKKKKEKRRFKLWQKIVSVIAIISLLTGIAFLLFPMVSNFFGQQRANGIIEDFNNTLDYVVPESGTNGKVPASVTSKNYADAVKNKEVDDEGYAIDNGGKRISDYPIVFKYDLDALYRDSVAYNKNLVNHQGTVETSNYKKAALNMSKYGLSNFYCYLSAPSIGMYLPVYLGANDSMMSCGAAHLAGTSLPIDMKDTNVAIAGHTGYIGRIFFDNIRNLETGDTVTVHNYWQTINYKVTGYKVVKPNDTTDIYIQNGKQMLTLITCIKSKDKGFDRYLVFCEKQ